MTRRVTGRLADYVALFERWNRSINLSAARTTDEIETHVLDCLEVVSHLPSTGRALDVGAGGGLPVVVAAIERPDLELVALEPVHKKHAFLRTVARELQLANLTALAERVDDHVRRDYDVAMSRATFDLREWIELGRTLVRPGGRVLGFEATLRDDLVQPFARHPYQLENKTRAIIVAVRA